MLATLLAAALTCAASLLLGQAALIICGASRWSWLAAPVGLSVLMVLAVPSLHLPGRTWTTGAIIALASAGAALLVARRPAAWPPRWGLAAGAGPLLLAVVPLVVAGRSGPLGVSISNDMAAHLLIADAHMDAALTPDVGPSYPLGPHAAVASIADPLGLPTDLAFTGFTMALPVLLGWTALELVPRAGRLAQLVIATLVGMPFLIAAAYGQGAFKEIVLAAVLMGLVGALCQHGTVATGVLRWMPAAILVVGVVSVYSYPGMVWPLLLLAAWAGVLAAIEWARSGPRAIVRVVRAELAPLALGVAAGIVALVPQWPRVIRYLEGTGGGTGLEETDLGNLVGPLPFLEGFGIWDNPDFRLPAVDPLATGAWAGLVLVTALAGAPWWLRTRRWIVPVAGLACALIWLYADRTQSPYVAAKALVILTPFAVLLALAPLVSPEGRTPAAPGHRRWALTLLAAVLAVKLVGSSWDALRQSMVGPRDHQQELRSLRPLLEGRATLFLGNDDFIRWELQGTPVLAPFIGAPGVPTRPEKDWQYGEAFDVDSVAPEVYDQVEWVIAPRDAAGSAVPRQLRRVRDTASFTLYRRVAPVPPREVLEEGEGAGAVLDCKGDPAARAAARGGGIAGIRSGGVAVPVPAVASGDTVAVQLPLPAAGTWDLVMPYTSPVPLDVSAPGLAPVTLPANLDRPGTRLPVGRLERSAAGAVAVEVTAHSHLLSDSSAPAVPAAIVAVPAGSEREVPVAAACGELVDYLLPARR